MEAFYRMYTARHRIVSEYFVQQVRAAAGSILDHEQPSRLPWRTPAISSSRLPWWAVRPACWRKKLLLLEGQNTAEAAPAAEPAPDCPAQPEPEEPTAEAVGEAEACSSS